ncbi:hypothetical protein H1P_3620004 [Hyella patelloides LEGE 07179]|uniref:Cas12f1-like TNB domain-containing protein n=1 Tax=Hyella patelloides LEGE 07179 TaxID=945734 RepID=A0A563VWC9_9CYAN|nr:zinc ribbon domain-containing protein [Hyella patelloides]VEP15721.1 hypothetical protein H1P_3620004 [Hyella patelloides LEGE 07179]
MEDLNVTGLIKNRHLSRALSDAAFGTIRTQTEYKCARYGSSLTLADRFFPSSQLCSSCGHRQKMPLKERVYNCAMVEQQNWYLYTSLIMFITVLSQTAVWFRFLKLRAKNEPGNQERL